MLSLVSCRVHVRNLRCRSGLSAQCARDGIELLRVVYTITRFSLGFRV